MGLALAASCGYRFAAGQARLEDGSRQLDLAPVRNLTLEPEVAYRLDACLRREIEQRGLELAGGAENVLEAQIVKVESLVDAATMAGGRYSSRLQRVVVRADFRLRRGGKPVWEKRLEAGESYLTAPDLRSSGANRQAALDGALQQLAEQALGQISGWW